MENFMRPYAAQLLSVLRIMAGLLILQFGTAKILGWPAVQMFANVAVGSWPLWYAGILELILGALLVVGLFTKPVAFILAGLMACAFFLGHVRPGGIIMPILNGGTLPALFCFTFLYISAAGGGVWSLDRMMRGTKD